MAETIMPSPLSAVNGRSLFPQSLTAFQIYYNDGTLITRLAQDRHIVDWMVQNS